MANVEIVLKNKVQAVWSISPESTVFDAIKLMEEKSIGALAVTQNNNLVGIISNAIMPGRSF